MDSPHMTTKKNDKYTLVELFIPKGVWVMGKFLANLRKLSFSNRNLKKYLEFKLNQYMDTVHTIEGGPIELVPMQWD